MESRAIVRPADASTHPTLLLKAVGRSEQLILEE